MKENLLRPVIKICEWMGVHCPKTYMKIRYFMRFHTFLDLKHPRTLNEKILYMSLCTDTTEWTRLADKYRVREYVHECGLDDILVKLYGVWDKAADCDFSQLPDRFVLKYNHGCHNVLVVNDKTALNEEEIKAKYQTFLDTPFGALESGLHYLRIQPKLIAEELLENDEVSARYSTSLIDYKIWCFNGKPTFTSTCCNRGPNGHDFMTYDVDWIAHPEYAIWDVSGHRGQLIPKPANYERMMAVAAKLSAGHPVVRVDLYNLNGKIYFGEMTFTSLGGMMDFHSPEFQIKCGNLIKLPETDFHD